MAATLRHLTLLALAHVHAASALRFGLGGGVQLVPHCLARPRSSPFRMGEAEKLNMDNAESIIGGEMCYKLDELTSEEASEAFRSIALEKYKQGTWYACSGPADDVELTCFLAPSWMGLPEGQWVCSDIPLDQAAGTAEDGY
eukprot:scaffold78806_cov35-Tisochrysis_lutea.AAC.1